ncbi:MAG: response regulator [Nitrospinota bacterium]
MKPKRILLVEDEGIVALDLKESLVHLGYDVVSTVSSGEDAVSVAEETKPDLVLMDIFLQGKMDGIEAASLIRMRHQIPIIYVTAYTDPKTFDRAKKTEPSGFIVSVHP